MPATAPAGPDVAQARRILIVRTSAIGDVVFASPLPATLRKHMPDAYIAWVVEPGIDALIANDPAIDECIVWPKREWQQCLRSGRLIALWRKVRAFRARLRAGRFDLALDLHGLAKSAFITWLSGAPRRIGLGSREGSHWLVTEVIPRGGDPFRISSEYQYLARHLGARADDFLPHLEIGSPARQRALALLERHGLSPGTYAVFAAFTTRPQKHWFDDAWIDLANQVYARTGLRPVLLGGASDRTAAAQLQASAPALLDLCGQTGLDEAAAIVRHAALLVGVDTGLTHMGIASSVPTVALFGSTRPYLETGRDNARVIWLALDCSPCGRNPTCGGAWTCMRNITTERVMQEIDLVRGTAS